jgi:hypothetical protein
MEIIQICQYQFWGNHKVENDRNMVVNRVESYKDMAYNMSLKVFFLDSHLDFFPENLKTVSEEHG